MGTKGELSPFWHDRNWRKILALNYFIQEFEMMEYGKPRRKSLYKKAMVQIGKLVKGELDIEDVMSKPDSPARNAYILMWVDIKQFHDSDQEKFKEKFRL